MRKLNLFTALIACLLLTFGCNKTNLAPNDKSVNSSTNDKSYYCYKCTYTLGYWKNHPEKWPVSSLTLGSITYTKDQLLQILNTPVQGNGLIALAHQLIAALLNIANGTNDNTVDEAIQDANTLIDGLNILNGGFLAPSETSELTDTLADYNEGIIGPGHCD